MEELVSQIQSLVRGGWKYRWQAVSIAWVISVLGFIIVLRLPDNYQSSARVFVDTQSILKPLLAGMTTIPNVEQQVSIMSRTLLSRPNVERVIRMVDLDINAKTEKEHEILIEKLVSDIKIGGTSQNDIYTITYNNENKKVAQDVVQALLTIFVEGSFGDKKQDSTKAVQFIDGQIKIYEEKLTAAENALKDFKLKNLGLLPGGGGDATSRLSEISDNINSARLELVEAEQARDSLKRQISTIENSYKDKAGGGAPNPEIDDRIQAINKNLDLLRLQYTEDHPDIVSAKRLLSQLQARKAEDAKTHKSDNDLTAASPVLQQLKISLSTAEARVASMRARVDEFGYRQSKLRAQSLAAPEIESQLAQLNRDYLINKENYEKLVASRDSAKLSGDLTNTTEMMTFKVVDPPTAPFKPVGPNRIGIMSLVFLAAVVFGAAAAVGLSKIRPTFLSHNDLLEITGLPILGTVSMNWTESEKLRQKKSLFGLAGSTLVLVLFFVGSLTFVYFR